MEVVLKRAELGGQARVLAVGRREQGGGEEEGEAEQFERDGERSHGAKRTRGRAPAQGRHQRMRPPFSPSPKSAAPQAQTRGRGGKRTLASAGVRTPSLPHRLTLTTS